MCICRVSIIGCVYSRIFAIVRIINHWFAESSIFQQVHCWHWSGIISGSVCRPFHCSLFRFSWRRKWQSIPVLLPGKSHGQRSLVRYSLWGRKELDTTEQLHFMGQMCWEKWFKCRLYSTNSVTLSK